MVLWCAQTVASGAGRARPLSVLCSRQACACVRRGHNGGAAAWALLVRQRGQAQALSSALPGGCCGFWQRPMHVCRSSSILHEGHGDAQMLLLPGLLQRLLPLQLPGSSQLQPPGPRPCPAPPRLRLCARTCSRLRWAWPWRARCTWATPTCLSPRLPQRTSRPCSSLC